MKKAPQLCRDVLASVFGLAPPRVQDRMLIEIGQLSMTRRTDRGQQLFLSEYPVRLVERAPNSSLRVLVDDAFPRAGSRLASFGQFSENYTSIRDDDPREGEPSWINGYLPPLDGACLYGLVASDKPREYIEIGSGNSTKFVAKAIRDHRLNTRIRSIDPEPREDVSRICDELIREPLERTDLAIFDDIRQGDHIFFDGTHRAFQNSDVVVFFTEILPVLPPGVLVGIHDIFLPADYPSGYQNRFYSEQYLLASFLIGAGGRVPIELPLYAVSGAAESQPAIDSMLPAGWPRLTRQRLWPWDDQVRPRGVGFWFLTAGQSETLP